MKELLDDIDRNKPRNPSRVFSKLSFYCSLVNLALLAVTINRIVYFFNFESYDIEPLAVLIWALMIGLGIGLIFTLISLINKEKLSFFKITGLIVNLAILLFIIGIFLS